MELKIGSFYTDEKYYYFVISSQGNYTSVFKTNLKGSRSVDLIRSTDDISNFREMERDDNIVNEYYVYVAKEMLN